MFERLLPDAVATAETRADASDAQLYPEEAELVRLAVEKRRREFATGRACARAALGRLGVAPAPIGSGPRGEPLWPAGIVGAITHCDGFRAAAVARAADVASVGIDAEPAEPLPPGILDSVASPEERRMLASLGPGVPFDRLLFCAKEAVYKAWYPLASAWLGFEDVRLAIDVPAAAFSAELLVEGPLVGAARLTGFAGRWAVEGDVVAATVVVPPG